MGGAAPRDTPAVVAVAMPRPPPTERRAGKPYEFSNTTQSFLRQRSYDVQTTQVPL